jgi:hypothetical protein
VVRLDERAQERLAVRGEDEVREGVGVPVYGGDFCYVEFDCEGISFEGREKEGGGGGGAGIREEGRQAG